jgi:hypothetical protein
MNRYYTSPYQYNNQQTGETKMLYSSLMIFDPRGKWVSDYGIKLNDLKSRGLEQTADFMFYKDQLALTFKGEDEIKFLSRKPDDTIEIDTLTTRLTNPTEKVRSDSRDDGSIRLWYLNKFYVWGYQSIRDRSRAFTEPSRYVFYINKIEVR